MIELIIARLIRYVSKVLGRGRRYKIYFSRKSRLMWYLIPKNASRTIRHHLQEEYHDFVFAGDIPIIRWLWRNYTKFAVLRPDEERYASTYRCSVLTWGNWTDKEYLDHLKMQDDPHVTPQAMLYDPTFVDIVVDMKNLNTLFDLLNIKIGKLEHLNKSI